MWISKSTLEDMKNEVAYLEDLNKQLYEINKKQAAQIENLLLTYPFKLGQVVYDVHLKNEKGQTTKKNPSREHCVINEVIVDKKNYFKLVERFNECLVHSIRDSAERHLDIICSKE